MEHFYQNIYGAFDFPDLYTNAINRLPQDSQSHIVEIGVWKGCSAAYLAVEAINSNKNIKIDLVDIWEKDGELDEVKRNLSPIIDNVTLIQLDSVKAAALYEDHSLDFIFIDANHEYNFVKKDIMAWLPKMKLGSVIAGHDYSHDCPDVIKAVNEIFSDRVNYLGRSWWIQL